MGTIMTRIHRGKNPPWLWIWWILLVGAGKKSRDSTKTPPRSHQPQQTFSCVTWPAPFTLLLLPTIVIEYGPASPDHREMRRASFKAPPPSFLFPVWCPVSWSSGLETQEPWGGGGGHAFFCVKASAGYRVDGYWAMKEKICSPARGLSLGALRENRLIGDFSVSLISR